MQIGVISDSHGNTRTTQNAARMLDALGVAEVLHCGDIGGAAIPGFLSRWPVHYVLGNCDYEEPALVEAIALCGGKYHARMGDLTLGGRRIALIHSDDARRFRECIDSGEYDLVCYGHTHLSKIETIGRTLVLNPGALHRANPHSLAIVDLEKLAATIVPL
jgi:putative phosphoesterase